MRVQECCQQPHGLCKYPDDYAGICDLLANTAGLIDRDHPELYIASSGMAAERVRKLLARALFDLGARVGLVIHQRQVLEVERRVDLGGSDTGMAQHFLHGAQVARRLQHMRGKRVA
jgi:hypothetical protein